ncbi:2-dehydro-3-deoxygalactonokinase [uncultured Roseovarius sp.]|uniref:2-dehydro-3-deoxygalactonokinase n=1 Tax=Roseovarius sp. TaxID=1486281 RepID=UPI0025F60438|nr:2-dehydro-3-deoxygalactonokinase [uncultured Roseovarius sp.]
MTDWAVIGHDGLQSRVFTMRGARILDQGCGADEAAALEGLGPRSRLYRIGEGQPDALPCPLLPGSGRSLAGLTQDSPPDVIDGWVRFILLGFAEAHPNWDGVACVLSDQLSHWVHLSANEAVSCQSFLTPRLITALGGALPPDSAAISDSLSRPERLAAHLRSAQVTATPAALSGHLLGAELAAARPYWLGQSVALIAPAGAASGYAAALGAQGVPVEQHAPDALLPGALAALARALGFSD